MVGDDNKVGTGHDGVHVCCVLITAERWLHEFQDILLRDLSDLPDVATRHFREQFIIDICGIGLLHVCLPAPWSS